MSSLVVGANVRTVLHVGCGPLDPRGVPHPAFRQGAWIEVRLDINPDVVPDILASITDMSPVPSARYDAVYSAHNIEHLYSHEVVPALMEFHRVLAPGGFVVIRTPDLQTVAEFAARGLLEETLYESPAGPIAALDIFFGHRASVAQGNFFMAHKTGFTAKTLAEKLQAAGFAQVEVRRLDNIELEAIAIKAAA